jgi:cell division protein FtsZ
MNLDYYKGKFDDNKIKIKENFRICAVGVGGAGSNTINRLSRFGLKEIYTIAINTDPIHLSTINADKKVHLSSSLLHGWGTGGDVELGERAIIAALDSLKTLFNDFDIVFIIAGFGGGTGTGATPLIADLAKRSGALVVSIVSIPFSIERARVAKAKQGVATLINFSQTIIMLENDKLMQLLPNFPLDKAFFVMDQLISEIILAFYNMLVQHNGININFSEIKKIFSSGKLSTILFNEGEIDNIKDLVSDTLNHPLIELDYSRSSDALIYINSGEELTLSEVMSIIDSIGARMNKRESIIWGTNIDPSLKNKIKLLCILTNIQIPFLEVKDDDSLNNILF